MQAESAPYDQGPLGHELDLTVFRILCIIVLIVENKKNKKTKKIELPLALFRSKTRQMMLRLFFENPDSSYYVRQLQAAFGTSVGTLHRELTHLEEIGILISEPRGKLKLYSIDKEHPLYEELKKIVIKTIGVEAALRDELAEVAGIKLAFTYGSFASGQETKSGDIPICLMGKIDEKELKKVFKRLEKQLGRSIVCTAMKESEFRRELKKHPPHLPEMFSGPKTFLVGEGDKLLAITR